MTTAVVHVHRGGPLVALVGNPNCGKTALFNLLTGSRQKVANYAGVTVERKEGRLSLRRTAATLRVLDLPGAYSLHPRSPDERVTRDVLFGQRGRREAPRPGGLRASTPPTCAATCAWCWRCSAWACPAWWR